MTSIGGLTFYSIPHGSCLINTQLLYLQGEFLASPILGQFALQLGLLGLWIKTFLIPSSLDELILA
jgi:hypothetical protein